MVTFPENKKEDTSKKRLPLCKKCKEEYPKVVRSVSFWIF